MIYSTGFRSGEFGGHSVRGTKSGKFRSARKRWYLVRDAPVHRDHRPVERQNPAMGYPEFVWQLLLGKKIVAIGYPIHFGIRLNKMDFRAAINKLLFKRYVQI